VIAVDAAADDVIPGLSSSVNDGDDMIESEIFRGTLFPAVLTRMVVPGIDIGPAEFNVLEVLPHFYIPEEPEYAWEFNGKTDASNLAIIFGKNFDFTLVKQAQRPLPGNDVYRLVGGIQN
jgi:hypothetical protein